MLKGYSKKQISKADMEKKAEAWKVLNSVLVSANAQYMKSLTNLLIEKEVVLKQLEEKLNSGEAKDEDNAEYLFQGGYVQCLKDILNAKKATE